MPKVGPKVTETSYYHGNMCYKGHSGLRYTATRDCVECTRERANKHRINNPEASRIRARRYSKANTETLATKLKNWRKLNPEKTKAQQKRARASGKGSAKRAKYRASQLLATPSWVDLNEIYEVYKQAELLTKELCVSHHVDHIVPLQSKKVCGLHVPWNLRAIPAADNLSKGNKMLTENEVSRTNGVSE